MVDFSPDRCGRLALGLAGVAVYPVRMPDELPTGFAALPRAGGSMAASLWRKLNLRVVHNLLEFPTRGLSRPVAGVLPEFRRLLIDALRSQPASVLAAVGSPDVRVPVLAMEDGAVLPDFALRSTVPSLLAMLASHGGERAIREAFIWDVPVDMIADDSRKRLVRYHPPARGLLVDRNIVEVRASDGSLLTYPASGDAGSDVFVRLPAGPTLSVFDSNPLADLEDHPDKHGNAVSLGDQPIARWSCALTDALELIETALPTLRSEMAHTVQRVVPVGYSETVHLSASYREAPGLLYVTLHPNALTMAEALVHESQHGKLNALSWFDALLHNGHTEWTTSPVRPDLRPLMGVLLAVHAFVPVAAMHLRLAAMEHPITVDPWFCRRRVDVLTSNTHGMNTLRKLAKPTALGQKVLSALYELHKFTMESVARAHIPVANVPTLNQLQ